MALKVGSLYVSLTARTGEFVKGLDKAVAAAEKAAKEIKRATKEVGDMGLKFAAALGVAVAVASKYDAEVEAAAKKTKDALATISVEIAKALLPAIKKMNDGLTNAIAFWQNMDPELRKNITSVALVTAQVLLLFAAMSKLSGLAGEMFGLARTLVRLGSVVAAPLAPIAIALGSIWVASAFVRNAMGADFKKIGEWAGKLWSSMTAGAKAFFEGVSKTLQAMLGWFGKTFENIRAIVIGGYLNMFRGLQLVMNKLPARLRVGLSGVVDGLKSLMLWTANLTTVDGFRSFWSDAMDAGSKAIDTMKEDVRDLASFVDRFLPKFEAGKPADLVNSAVELGDGADFERPRAFVESTKDFRKMALGYQSDVMAAIEHMHADWARRAVEQMQRAVESLADMFTSRLGRAGDLMRTAMDGFTAGGGPWGAVIAVFADLLTSSKTFTRIIALVDHGLQAIGDMLGTMLSGLVQLSGAGNNINAAINRTIAPLFKLIGEALANMAPVLQMVATIVDAFAPLLTLLFEGLGFLVNTIFGIVMRGVFEALRAIGVVLVGVLKVLGDAWNALAGALGINLKINMDGLNSAFDTLLNTSFDLAMAKADEAAQSVLLADKAQAVAEALTNIPNGFRVAAQRYAAMDVQGMGPLVPSGAALPSSGGSGGNVTVIVEGNVVGFEDFAEELTEAQRNARRKKHGGRGGSF